MDYKINFSLNDRNLKHLGLENLPGEISASIQQAEKMEDDIKQFEERSQRLKAQLHFILKYFCCFTAAIYMFIFCAFLYLTMSWQLKFYALVITIILPYIMSCLKVIVAVAYEDKLNGRNAKLNEMYKKRNDHLKELLHEVRFRAIRGDVHLQYMTRKLLNYPSTSRQTQQFDQGSYRYTCDKSCGMDEAVIWKDA